MNKRLEIHSPLSPDECARRISAAIDHERSALFSVSSLTGSLPVAGHVDGSIIRLRKRIVYRNSFQTILTATMRPERAGTVIQGEFAMHALPRVFLTIWFGVFLIIVGTSFVSSLVAMFAHPLEPRHGSWLSLLKMPGMVLFAVLVVCFGRYSARDEARFLTDFLRCTLDADADDQSRNAS